VDAAEHSLPNPRRVCDLARHTLLAWWHSGAWFRAQSDAELQLLCTLLPRWQHPEVDATARVRVTLPPRAVPLSPLTAGERQGGGRAGLWLEARWLTGGSAQDDSSEAAKGPCDDWGVNDRVLAAIAAAASAGRKWGVRAARTAPRTILLSPVVAAAAKWLVLYSNSCHVTCQYHIHTHTYMSVGWRVHSFRTLCRRLRSGCAARARGGAAVAARSSAARPRLAEAAAPAPAPPPAPRSR
jgi:hypothetical protein